MDESRDLDIDGRKKQNREEYKRLHKSVIQKTKEVKK